ncbi:MAG: urea ABC transporter permease subunit UrtB [Pseudomonadota bacterium]
MSVRFLAAFLLFFCTGLSGALSQTQSDGFQALLQENFKLIKRSSVKTVGPLLEKIQQSGFEGSTEFLGKWQLKEVWYRKEDETLFYVKTDDKKTYQLIDIETGETIGEVPKRELRQIKPNSGVRALIAGVLVASRLSSPDLEVRRSSLDSISRNPKPEHLEALKEAVKNEPDPTLKVRFKTVADLLAMQFADDVDERVNAIKTFSGDLRLEVRASLNPLLASTVRFATNVPENINLARVIVPGKTVLRDDGSAQTYSLIDWLNDRAIEIEIVEAYEMLANDNLVKPIVSDKQRDAALIANLENDQVAGFQFEKLNTEEMRNEAYAALANLGKVEPRPNPQDIVEAVERYTFYAEYNDPNLAVTNAARETLATINFSVRWNTFLDLLLDAVSLASIYFLAAIGLAITFGVMRVINMAHGEFIMMGAYSGYVVQQFITNYTLSIVVAIPVAFAVTFAAGVILERLVIRHLYDRPLETLLATFGVGIALQQLAKNIFGTQARPLTAPDWLDGALVINDVVSISWIRIAIFVLGVVFFCGLWWTLNKTRLGLETRAVVQNPRMAASMGINPDRINMLTFGLGSGIAGIAGVAIGLYAKVTSELGSEYIVQSFMTVVIGGVGNIWGTLAGAGLIGILQKLIENFNPSNTLAAQTYMIIFIIIFIQFRPRGIIALKGRAAEA